MELHRLEISVRDKGRGKGPAHRLRKTGRIPVILYGGNKDAVSVEVDEKDFNHLIHGRGGEHAIVQLECEGRPELNSPAILKAVQHHPVRGDALHADFLRIRLDERIHTSVPVVLTGQAKGVVEGGVLDHQLRELEVECLALEVPEQLLVDVSDIDIGEGLHVSDIEVPANVTVLTESERAVVAVLAPRIIEEAVPEGEEEAVEGEEGEAAQTEEGGAPSEKKEEKE
ncbi:MAG: 50S ribosomal protein L25 [Candidatus Hydrogenedentes bacterium]|nr:50S ribosomal protein L25 [Candidatus Hydrogenedentota bacterium]